MSLTAKGLTKVYGEQSAANNLSFSVADGEVVGLLGPNGAGKSTTMKMLTCYITPTEGDATVGGYSILNDQQNVKKSVGYLPEHNPLYHEMYVKEYLQYVARIHHVSHKNIKPVIERVGLQLEQHKKIGSLSKGYRQRVGLAQAILHDPKVLILDEPTSGLDPNQIVDIRQLIIDLGKEKTVILSTHLMQEVEALCKRVIIINKGNIVADDTTQAILSRSKLNTLLIKFRKQEPALLNQIKSLPNVADVAEEDGCFRVSYKDEGKVKDSLFQYASSTTNPIYELRNERATLEAAFQQLTKKEV